MRGRLDARAALAGTMVAVAGAAFALSGCAADQSAQPAEESAVTEVEEPQQTGPANATARGYTFAVDVVTVDENGIGSASFSLSNPDGVGGTLDESGALVAGGGEAAFDALRVRVGSDEISGRPNTRFVVDEAASSETELVGTLYFDVRGLASADDGVFCQIAWHEGTDGLAETSQPLELERVWAQGFVDDGAGVAFLSPVGLVASTGASPDEGQFVDSLVTIQMDDGSEVVVFGAEGAVSATQSARENGSSSYALLDPMDVNVVRSITVEGTLLGADGSEEPQTHVYKPGA